MPELVIDDEPSIVGFVTPLEDFDGFYSYLTIVLVTESGNAGTNANGVNLTDNARGACAEDVEGLGIDVAIDYYCSCACGLYEVFKGYPCCEKLAIEEDHLCRWCGGSDEEVELLIVLVESLLNGIEAGIDSLL